MDLFHVETNFELYSHLKSNVKCLVSTCEIHDSNFKLYCFQCKRAICEVCKINFHSTHSVISKEAVIATERSVDQIFSSLESLINTTEAFSKPDKIIRDSKTRIEKEFNSLTDKLNQLKALRLLQVDSTYSAYSEAEELLKNINCSKSLFIEFYGKHKDFLLGERITDDDSFIFLQLYEIQNLAMSASRRYTEIINQLKEFYSDNDLNLDNKFDNIMKSIELSIDQQKQLLVITEAHKAQKMSEKSPAEKKEKKKFKSNKALEMRVQNKEPLSSININPETQNSEIKRIERDKLLENMYSESNLKIAELESHITDFKDFVYSSFKKENSLGEIEKLVKMFEEKTSKRINFATKSVRFGNSSTKSGILQRSKVSLDVINKEKRKEEIKKREEIERKRNIDKVLLGERIGDKVEKSISPKNSNNNGNSPIKEKNFKNSLMNSTGQRDLFSLEENEDEDNENIDFEKNEEREIEDEYSDQDPREEEVEEDEGELEVNLSKNVKNTDKTQLKLNNMFKPRPKQNFQEKRRMSAAVSNNKTVANEDEKFKLNCKLIELINENKRLINLIKTKNDITLQITTVRRYYSFFTLESCRKKSPLLSSGVSNSFLDFDGEQLVRHEENITKIIEGTNEIHVYNRKERKIQKLKVAFDKKSGTNHFYVGSRFVSYQDKVYITGGKDSIGEKASFFYYDLKSKKLTRMPDMASSRCYHSVQYHESLKSLFVFGGENNGTCEMYDFYLNMWNSIPNLNIARANSSVYLDKLGTFAYSICGQIGSISNQTYTDVVEFLDMVDMNQGWSKVELKNKGNIDLKSNEIKVKHLDEDRLLIYGGKESRSLKICFCIFNMKTSELTKVDEDQQEKLRMLTLN